MKQLFHLGRICKFPGGADEGKKGTDCPQKIWYVDSCSDNDCPADEGVS